MSQSGSVGASPAPRQKLTAKISEYEWGRDDCTMCQVNMLGEGGLAETKLALLAQVKVHESEASNKSP